MATSSTFPPVSLVDFEVQRHPRFGDMREVAPLVDRDPAEDWCGIFYIECESSPEIDWKTAGFALCADEDVETTEAHLRDITERTNKRFASFLATAEPRSAAEQLLELENIAAASVRADDAYRVRWPK